MFRALVVRSPQKRFSWTLTPQKRFSWTLTPQKRFSWTLTPQKRFPWTLTRLWTMKLLMLYGPMELLGACLVAHCILEAAHKVVCDLTSRGRCSDLPKLTVFAVFLLEFVISVHFRFTGSSH